MDGQFPELSEAENRYFEAQGAEIGEEPKEERAEVGDAVSEEAREPSAEAEEGAKASEDGSDKPKTVPHGAFHEEREKRKKEEAARRALEDKIKVMEDRFSAVMQQIQQPQRQPEPEPPPPNPEEDIFGAFRHTQQKLQELEARDKQVREHQQRQQQINSVLYRYKSDADAFSGETPDFKDAYGHLVQSRHAELEAMGFADPAQREQIIRQNEMEVVFNAYRMGKNPAQVVYEMARHRGYARKEQQAARPDPRAKLESVAASQVANKSLSSAGGSSGGGQMTLERLAAMSNEDFAEYMAKNPKTVDRLMGKV